MINLYKLYFQPNKKVFHPSIFPPSQLNINEGNKIFSILSLFSILPLFHSPNQTDPKDSKQQIRRRKNEKEKKKKGSEQKKLKEEDEEITS